MLLLIFSFLTTDSSPAFNGCGGDVCKNNFAVGEYEGSGKIVPCRGGFPVTFRFLQKFLCDLGIPFSVHVEDAYDLLRADIPTGTYMNVHVFTSERLTDYLLSLTGITKYMNIFPSVAASA